MPLSGHKSGTQNSVVKTFWKNSADTTCITSQTLGFKKKLGHQHVHVASNHKYRPENAFEAHAMSTSANNCKNHRITGLLELPINGGNWHAMPEYSLEHPCKKHLL